MGRKAVGGDDVVVDRGAADEGKDAVDEGGDDVGEGRDDVDEGCDAVGGSPRR